MEKWTITGVMKNVARVLLGIRVKAFFKFNVYELIRYGDKRKELKEKRCSTARKIGKSRLTLYWDMVFKSFVTNADYMDYFKFSFYNKPLKVINRYMTRGRYSRFYPYFSTYEVKKIMREKDLFLSVFKDYTRRDWLALNDDLTIGQLTEFTSKHGIFIAKPRSLNQGRGIEIVDVSGFQSMLELLVYLKAKNIFVIEELVHNHETLSKFSVKSLNIIRIITLRLPEGVEVICSLLRCNIDGGFVDDFSPGIYECPIDIDNGMIIKGIRDNVNLEQYSARHPFGFDVVGIKIPYWKETLDMVKKAALTLDNVLFIPWDVAISPGGPLIIEGNSNCGYKFSIIHDQLDTYQIIKQSCKYAKKQAKGKASPVRTLKR